MRYNKIATSKTNAGFTLTPNHIGSVIAIQTTVANFIKQSSKPKFGVTSQRAGGFTLIELLVVIAIIGLLASVVLVSLNGARKKGRSAKRQADMVQIQTALELYYNDNNTYPVVPWAWRSECVAWGGLTQDQVIPGLVPTYMARFPSDPSMDKAGNRSCYLYLSNGTGTDYKLLDHDIAEYSSQDYLSASKFVDPARDSGPNGCLVDGTGIWSWGLSTPGACTW